MKSEYSTYTQQQEDTIKLILKTCAFEALSMKTPFAKSLQSVFLMKKKEGFFGDITTDMAKDLFNHGLLNEYLYDMMFGKRQKIGNI